MLHRITFIITALITSSIRAQPQAKLTTQWDNDAFTFQKTGAIKDELSDDNYSNGLKLQYSKNNLDLFLHHEIYTPTILIVPFNVPSDRPYAASLYGGFTTHQFNNSTHSKTSLALGVVGPTAKGETIQKNWHKFTKDVQPMGWNNQLHDEPIINCSYSHTYYTPSKSPFKFLPNWEINAGNMLTDANTGLTIEYGNPLSPQQKRFANNYYSIFTGINAQAVAHNIFLDGNTTGKNNNPIDKKTFVINQFIGFEKIYTNYGLSFTYNKASQEFKNQVGDGNKYGGHSFGSFQFFKLF